MTDSPAKRWPVEQAPARIDASAALEQLRNNLRARVGYIVDVLGFKASMIATTAKMSEKGLQGYAEAGWNPTPSTMIQLDETIEHHLDTWIEAARNAQISTSGAGK